MSTALEPRRRAHVFDPDRHEQALVAVIEAIAAEPALDARGLDRILKRHPKDGRGLFSKSDVIAGFRRFASRRGLPLSEDAFCERLRRRPVRSASGVTPVTVLTRPFPCPGRCVFCPSDARMPKSYLSAEPGAQRAADNGFDPYLQTWNRVAAFAAIGHPVDKVELIVLGGTWSSYPEPYQVWFVKRCLDALADFGRGEDRRAAAGRERLPFETLPARAGGRAGTRGYNRVVRDFLAGALDGSLLHPGERVRWEELAAAQRGNESAACRCVGLSLETRPDRVDPGEVLRLRRLGATKLQLGLQSLSDAVLAANRRGHDVAASRRALRLLRAAGFKLQVHWMANLLGATPEGDAEDFARLFADADFRPDELKLYPCSLVESAELAVHHRRGAWRPYAEHELMELLVACLARVPRYCRVSRVIRDFSASDIAAGSRTANLREVAERELAARGLACRDIRAREIRRRPVDAAELSLRETRYAAGDAEELFLELATRDDRLAGFARLSLPRSPGGVAEIRHSALLRELHVYGAAQPLGRRAPGAAQHAGLGRRLVEAAAAAARAAGFSELAVISAVGTRGYYRALGFRDGELYQQRGLV